MKLMKSQIEENSKIIKFFMEDFIIRIGVTHLKYKTK